MKKILKKIIFWEILALMMLLLVDSCAGPGCHWALFFAIVITLTILLGIMAKDIFYGLVIGCLYIACGVSLAIDWVRNYFRNRRKLKKDVEDLRKEVFYL